MNQLFTRKNDGTQFVARLSRSAIPVDEKGSLKKTLLDNSEFEGDKVVLTVSDEGEIHVGASFDDGYSVGECATEYFEKLLSSDKPNVVWCEELGNDEHESVLVIIVNGTVEFDAIVPPASIDQSAATILAASKEKFNVYVYGDVPLAQTDGYDFNESIKLSIREELVNSYNELDSGIVDKLEISAASKLEPINKAISKAGLGGSALLPLLIISLVIIGGLIHFVDDKGGHIKDLAQRIVVDDYKDYRVELQTPSPLISFRRFLHEVDTVSTISGLGFIEASLEEGNVRVTYTIVDGSILAAKKELEALGWSVVVGNLKILAVKQLVLNQRIQTNKIYDFNDVVARLTADGVAAGIKVSVGQPKSTGKYMFSDYFIEYERGSPDIEQYVQFMLVNMPLKLNNVKVLSESNNSKLVKLNVTAYGKG